MSDAQAPVAPEVAPTDQVPAPAPAAPAEVTGAVVQHDMDAAPTADQAAAVDGLDSADKHAPVDGGPDVLADGFTPKGEEGPTLGISAEDADAINKRVEDYLAEEHEKGYRGYNPDQRSNDEYTLAGVIAKAAEGPQPRQQDNKLQYEGAAHPGNLQDEHPQGAGPTGA